MARQNDRELRKADKIIVLANASNLSSSREQSNRLYSAGGLAPTISTFCGGGQEPKIIEVIYEDKGKQQKRFL